MRRFVSCYFIGASKSSFLLLYLMKLYLFSEPDPGFIPVLPQCDADIMQQGEVAFHPQHKGNVRQKGKSFKKNELEKTHQLDLLLQGYCHDQSTY